MTQRTFTIEMRVDYQDTGKYEEFKKLVIQAALRLQANAVLLKEHVTPEVAAWSDDWFAGQDKFSLYQDPIPEGTKQIGEDNEDQEPVSASLLQAMREDQG